jgi:opacity protein-like surface antigen
VRPMVSRALVVLLAAAAVLVALPGRAAAATSNAIQHSTSANWAGYVVEGSAFSSVSGSWVVPAVRTSSPGWSAAWVGLGGATDASQALEQVGTESDAVNGRARYRAWYELVPAASRRLALTIRAGDRMSARVTVVGTTVTVSLADRTTGRSVTKTRQMSAPDTSSAEWIVEAPSASLGDGRLRQLPLARFGTVPFTRASVTANGHAGAIADPAWTAERVRLAERDGSRAVPSALPPAGTAFTVAHRG